LDYQAVYKTETFDGFKKNTEVVNEDSGGG